MTILSTSIYNTEGLDTHQPGDSVGPGMTPGSAPPTEPGRKYNNLGKISGDCRTSKRMCYMPIGRDAVPPEMMISYDKLMDLGISQDFQTKP